MPSNLYGPGDNYDSKNSHVIPALIKKFHNAKIKNLPSVFIWGTGKPKREFLHVDDLAKACVHVMNLKKSLYYKKTDRVNTHINVGSGKEITIKNLAELIKKVVSYKGKIKFDTSKPDGTLSKLMCNKRIQELNWKHEIELEEGIQQVYSAFANKKII